MKKGMNSAIGLAAVLMFALAAAPAAAITITETADFGFSPPTAVGTLTPGTSTISGSVHATCPGTSRGPATLVFCNFGNGAYDSVSFVIPDGFVLSAATATFSNLSTSGKGILRVGGRSIRGRPGDLGFLFPVDSSGTFDILPGAPLTGTQSYTIAPVLTISQIVDHPRIIEGDTVSFDWSLGLTVERTVQAAPVPEPPTLPLTLGALGLIFLTFVFGQRRA